MNYIWTAFKLNPVAEYRFHPKRLWRFDYAFPAHKIAIEIEGGIWTRGRHVNPIGYLKDIEKYNEAARLGWRVFRFTPQELKKGIPQSYISDVLKEICP